MRKTFELNRCKKLNQFFKEYEEGYKNDCSKNPETPFCRNLRGIVGLMKEELNECQMDMTDKKLKK